VIDGEAIVTDDKGLAVFDLIRGHRHHVGAELCAFATWIEDEKVVVVESADGRQKSIESAVTRLRNRWPSKCWSSSRKSAQSADN
jgi:hypothetical protein